MSIHFKKDNKIIQINTENSMYQMQIDKYVLWKKYRR